jgi:hypothetical protein
VTRAKRVKGIRCDGPVGENARLIIETRLLEMLSFGPWVDDPANVEQIHNLRIAAKRLRYSLELFRFSLPPAAGGLIDEVKHIQEQIGDMHDADVMIERVLEGITSDSELRLQRLIEIASAVDRGSVAQRHQRIRSAMANRATPRDELAFFALIAQRANDRDDAYARFVAAWRTLEETDFPTRLRRTIGMVSENAAEPESASDPAGKRAAG